MPTDMRTVKPSLREVLADSHISAVAIAVLLLWSLDAGFRALLGPLSRVGSLLFTGVAIMGIPYLSFDITDRLNLITAFSYAFGGIISLTAAWLLSRWVYGVGPLRCLSAYRTKRARRNHV
jgi:hypothetical protein